MDENQASSQTADTVNRFSREQFNEKVEERYYRGMNYLSIYAFIIVVYGGGLITDFLLFGLINWLLREDIQRYPPVALWFDYAKIGLALLLIIAAVFHGVISTWGQMKLDIEIAREG